MNMLIEKRNEIIDKIKKLEEERISNINKKVSNYKNNIEVMVQDYKNKLIQEFNEYVEKVTLAEAYTEEYYNLNKVLEAIDEIIKYDNSNFSIDLEESNIQTEINPVEEIKEVYVDSTNSNEVEIDISNLEPANHETRPGMTYVGIPERK